MLFFNISNKKTIGQIWNGWVSSTIYRSSVTSKKSFSEIDLRLPTAPWSISLQKTRIFYLCYSYGKWGWQYFRFFYRCILLNYIIHRIQMTKNDHQFIIYPALCIYSSKCGKINRRTHHAEVAGSRPPPYYSPTMLNFGFLTIVLGLLV